MKHMKRGTAAILMLALLLLSATAMGETVYPIAGAENVTLTYCKLNYEQVSSQYPSLADTPFFQAYSAATGVTIETMTPADNTAMNLIFASGDLPDMIHWNWNSYSGGISKAISDGIVLPLNDLLEEYAPAYNALIHSNEDYQRAALTANGDVYGFAFIRGHKDLVTYSGPIIRADWLEKCGLEMPQTIGEFYDMLVAFRDQCGATYPLSTTPSYIAGDDQGSFILGAFGVPRTSFYRDGETVKFGFYEAGMKDAYAFLHQLYTEGLLDPNFSTLDTATINSNFYNGVSGVVTGLLGSGIGNHLSAMADDPEFDVAGMNYLVADEKKGELPISGHSDFPVTAEATVITTTCEYPEIAAQVLDYGYTEEGHMLFNFGIEGESYEMVDGYPTYTELITHNPDGLSMQYAMAPYMLSWNGGNMVQDERYSYQYSGLPQQQAALATWANTTVTDHIMPPLTIPDDQSARFASLGNDITTYCNEMRIKFITGEESLENFDAYLETLRNMGVEEYIAIEQAAYDEYLSR